ncbi:tyrosine-type recombinase/integrase [Paraburkholderia acidisoli]|uniref:Tyrosine-type recombinase/integrase n=1 Tax=Paraburkholderia acidisoli TaxID=2571748 RepID=A0A7Z2GG86_9BURK|nr:integrase family protein [Paraburkholderia acidisoli]QGZ61093.1 tyrosine-type recombinase/integrase [Paraburkholderia acidisoli]
MNKENFTPERISGYRCESGRQQTIYWDKKQQGLGLRVTASGSKAFVCEGRLFGKTVRITIGSPDIWPLERVVTVDHSTGDKIERVGARQEAARLKALFDRDIDPREQKAEQRAAHEARQLESRRKDAAVEDAWHKYLAAHRSKWSERHYEDHQRAAQAGGEKKRRGAGLTVAGPLAPLMQLRLSDLNAAHIASWMNAEVQLRPTNAEQAYRKLRAFIRWCDEQQEFSKLVPEGAYSARAVRDAVPRPKAKGDCLQREQLATWFEAVGRINNQVISIYLQALLLTGARREELAGLRWNDVDFRWLSLHVSDKIEKETGRYIPLTPYLAHLLLKLKQANDTAPPARAIAPHTGEDPAWKPSEWVFSSPRSADGKIAEPRIAHKKAQKSAGLPNISLHGLRRSFSTLSEWVECPVGVVAQIQGHKPSALAEKHYRRRSIDLLRLWHNRIEAWMLVEAGIEFVTEDNNPTM